MKLMLLILTFCLAGPLALAEEATPYRGYTAINRLLKERIITQNSTWELGQYLGEKRSEPKTNGGLLALLGTYLGSDTEGTFRNGTPNSINSILWYTALSGLALDVAKLCGAKPPAKPLPVREEFWAALKPLCAWPATEAQTPASLFSFWSAIAGFEVPPEEFDAWRDFFLSAPYAKQNAETTLQAMVLAITYHPQFLLRK